MTTASEYELIIITVSTHTVSHCSIAIINTSAVATHTHTQSTSHQRVYSISHQSTLATIDSATDNTHRLLTGEISTELVWQNGSITAAAYNSTCNQKYNESSEPSSVCSFKLTY